MNSCTFVRTSIILFVLVLSAIPVSTYASTARPSCNLVMETKRGEVPLKNKDSVFIQKGDAFTITWSSKNATKAFDAQGNDIALTGSSTYTVLKKGTYTYNFSHGSNRIKCVFAVIAVTGSFTDTEIGSISSTPTLSGKALGIKKVYVSIYKEGGFKSVYTSRSISVKNGEWKTKVTKKLPDGVYSMVLLGEKGSFVNAIAERTLTIGKSVDATLGTIVVAPVPLLVGGTAHTSSDVPVSYLQVANIGMESVTIHSFTVTEKGSAPMEMVSSFSVFDDLGNVRGSVIVPSIKNSSVRIPVTVVIAPNEMRLFTIKATLGSILSQYVGTQLQIEIASTETTGTAKGMFPIQGTTWTLAL